MCYIDCTVPSCIIHPKEYFTIYKFKNTNKLFIGTKQNLVSPVPTKIRLKSNILKDYRTQFTIPNLFKLIMCHLSYPTRYKKSAYWHETFENRQGDKVQEYQIN